MSDNDSHRRAILMRRALFLSTALGAIGCPSRDEPAVDPAGASTPGESLASAPQPRTKRRAPPTVPSNTPWSEVMANAPPREVPSGLPSAEAGHLEGLREEVEANYEALRKAWVLTPGCDPAAASCEDWQAVADAARDMYRSIDRVVIGGCGRRYGVTGSVAARREAHREYMHALIARLEAHLEQLAIHHGAAGADAWHGLLKKAKEPAPRPCLKPCMAPEDHDILTSIPFAKGDASLPADALVSLEFVRDEQRAQSTTTVLVVRGHADPTESAPTELAERRARAVAAWLVKNGLAPADVTTSSLGTKLAVEKPGGAGNRRVDFEVVPR